MSTLENKIKKVMPVTKDHEQVLDLIFTPEEEKVSTTIDVEIPVKNGVGSKDFGWIPTVGATVKGYAEITAPDGGTWDVHVYDKTAKKYILQKYGVKKGEQVHDSYKTSFWGVQPVINVKWSQSGDTTLKIKLVGSIG